MKRWWIRQKWWLAPFSLSMTPLMVGFLVTSCESRSECADTRPKRVRVDMEESDGWSFQVGHAVIEGHRYITVSSAHWGGVVHDPKCKCQVQSLPAEQPAEVR